MKLKEKKKKAKKSLAKHVNDQTVKVLNLHTKADKTTEAELGR